MNRESFELHERDEFPFDAEKFSAFRDAAKSPREPEYCEMMQDVDALKRREKRKKIKTAAAIIIGFVSAAICCLGLI